jgi:hypothetical protein
MAMRQRLRQLSSLVVLGALAALLPMSSTAHAQPFQNGSAESTMAAFPFRAPIEGVWAGDAVGLKVTFEVFRIGPAKFRALSIHPELGCEVFLVGGSGLHYEGRGGADCDGTGPSFEIVVTISRDRNQLTLGPRPGEPGESIVFYRVS